MEQRRGLGRGIASLISSRPFAAPRPVENNENKNDDEKRSFLKVPLSEIVPNPSQPRKFFDEQKIQELADSIREKGILLPLLVTRHHGHYELVSGERRFRAATLAGLKEVPIIVREAEPSEALEIAIIENVQREDLDPIEEASAYQALIDRFAYTQDQVAQKVGKERATIANLLRLLKLPTKIRQALQSGQVTMGHARALLGVADIEKQLYFMERILEEGWSVRELELRITSKKVAGLKRILPSSLIRLLDEMRRRLGTQVRIVPSGKKGKIVIEYYSETDLDRVYNIIVK